MHSDNATAKHFPIVFRVRDGIIMHIFMTFACLLQEWVHEKKEPNIGGRSNIELRDFDECYIISRLQLCQKENIKEIARKCNSGVVLSRFFA
jgi:hypothetical protein